MALGLLYKVIRILLSTYFDLLKSYVHKREFETKINGETSSRYYIKSGVPPGRIIGHLLYTLYASDIPATEETIIGTFRDDTAVPINLQ